MKRFYVIPKKDSLSQALATKVNRVLTENGLIIDENEPELVIIIGGDGKFLRAVHKYLNILDKVSFVGVHTGTLGFYTDFPHSELDTLLELIIKDEYEIEKKNLIEASVKGYDGNILEVLYGLNEFRIENCVCTQKIDIYLNNEYLERFRGNGVCISTQSGSTGLNRSLGGAIVFPGVECLQLSEIAGISHNEYHSLKNPLLIPSDMTVTLVSDDFRNVVLGHDHKIKRYQKISSIICKPSDKQVNFIRYLPYSFIKRIRKSFIIDKTIK